ncbi:metallophosphoesterase [Neorhizobium galegae]|uniref:metallophosphoesterase family protein n=1 Tax=Neorhizobium galegae TaxID=399 RepID=UPI0021062322|nr:metallophosphoesterase [Neorhizobium galegae]MCQ1764718.1 metallophosphoesterase [Neorhizobium galegae]MCQ1849289.1 metallophosphoesterase [Neorhizobium galegae]
MPTLLHLSDLHRSKADPLDNDTLLASLLSDIDRYALTSERPEALIVSGDLVQGVGVGAANFHREMKQQYEVAFDLIGRLCEELLEGDRSRVVVVPGNHDICWNTSISSVEPVVEDRYPTFLKQGLSERDGMLRWSWDERRLYRVADKEAYERRLEAYWEGVEGFYAGVDLPLPIDRRRGFNLFQLFDKAMVVAAFESTHRNDHLRFEAELATGVVSRCSLELRKLKLNPSLLAAVWHHSIHGPPNKDDYLNIETVTEMAGLGFQIGFHGHQHLADSTDLSVSVGGGSTMCVVSAGSLCAGWTDLPRGINRQYNIVRLDADLTSATLHIREMVEGSQFSAMRRGRFVDGEVPLSWSPKLNAAGQPAKSDEKRLNELTFAIEEAVRRRVTSPATGELLALKPATGTYPRKVLLSGLQLASDWQAIRNNFWPSGSPDEAMAVAEAAYQLNDIGGLDAVLLSGQLPDAHSDDFKVRREMLSMRGGR